MANRRVALVAVLGCGLLLAACTATPVYPMLSPIQVAKNFGYFDQPIDDTHWLVSYVTPQQSGYGFRYDQSPAEAQAKTLAMDMALWHASQVAQAHGYAGFAVTDRPFQHRCRECRGFLLRRSLLVRLPPSSLGRLGLGRRMGWSMGRPRLLRSAAIALAGRGEADHRADPGAEG
ncbi:MAG: hypothetical protein WDN69_03450 [Aliidongia sp.]